MSGFESCVGSCSGADGDAAKCELRLRLRSRESSRTNLALRSLVVGEGVMLMLLLNYCCGVVSQRMEHCSIAIEYKGNLYAQSEEQQ